MTKCDKCGLEAGNLFCGHCRKEVEEKAHRLKVGKLVPLISYDTENKCYLIHCQCVGCPTNINGVCATKHGSIVGIKNLLHEYDGDNCIHQICG